MSPPPSAVARPRSRWGLSSARWWTLAAALLGSCASPGAPDTRRVLLSDLTVALIVPIHAQFERRAQILEESSEALCTAADAERLDAARRAWWSAREPWKQAEVFAFGPYNRPEYRLGPRIDTWPVDPQRVQELLDQTTLLDAAALSGAAISQRGLPVVEYLLHGEGSLERSQLQGRRCEYLRAATGDLADNARAMHRAWSPEGDDFSRELSQAGRGGTAFRSLRHAFGEVVNRIVFTLENARRDKLGRPLGEDTGSPQPQLSESRASGRAVQDLRDVLEGIEWLYFGRDAFESGGPRFDGLVQYARERGYDFDAVLREQFDGARSALDAVEPSLAEAVVDDPASVEAVSARLLELQRTFEVDVVGALGVTLSFNDNDGD